MKPSATLRLSFLFFCSSFFGSAGAESVSHAQALGVARQFMAERGLTIPETATSRAASDGDSQSPRPYYVFNADRGFVVVSGDDRTAAVLGYTDSGTFDESNLPDGLKWMLQTYSEQIAQLDDVFTLHASRKLAPAASREPQPYHSPTRHVVDPLLPMTWNQGDPYNLLCPVYYNEDGSLGNHSATGCVATAMAQVIGYYRWPEKTKQSIPGYIQKYNTTQGEKSVRLSTIPSGSVIDWDNILNNYNGSETEAQKQAIAELMLWVGMDCKMSYGASSGSGYSEGIDGLVKYFDYDDGTHVAKRDMYTLQQWNDLIYNEIATGHPVPFGGQNSGGGHAFVLDGYDANGLFHVNWGWGGMSNGYFRIDVLDPDNTTGIGASLTPGGYNMGQDAIVGMRRPDGIKADEEDTPQYRYKLSANDWSLRGTNRFFANYVNWSGVSATWNMGIGYVNEEGKLTPIGNYSTYQLNQNFYIGLEFTVSGLPEGTYHIVPISKRSTDKAWRTNMSPDLRFIYTEVDGSGNVVKMEMRPIANIAMTGLSFPGNHKRGDNQPVAATFRNDGDDELFTEIHLLASRTDDKGSATSRTAIDVRKGEETTVALNFKPEESGKWNVWLATDNRGENVVGQGTIDISDEGIVTNQQLRYVSHTISNKSNGNILGTCMQGKVTILNEGTEQFDGKVRLWLFKDGNNGYFYPDASIYVPVSIAPKGRGTAAFTFNNLQLNAHYVMSILYEQGGDIRDGGLREMGRPQQGVIYWKQNMTMGALQPAATMTIPSDVVAVDMTAYKGNTTVRPNANPNTVYLLAEGASVPNGLENVNIVIGGKASAISLTDGFAFMTPTPIKADHVTYTRNGTAGLWETLALPFVPQQLPDGLHVMTFTHTDKEGHAVLTELGAMEQMVPYLVRSDDDAALTFSATDVAIPVITDNTVMAFTDSYRFLGTTISQRLADVLVLNDAATAFERTANQTTIPAFRAYFEAPAGVDRIDVPQAEPTGIADLEEHRSNDSQGLYDLQGRRVLTPSHGLYIQNHRIVRK